MTAPRNFHPALNDLVSGYLGDTNKEQVVVISDLLSLLENNFSVNSYLDLPKLNTEPDAPSSASIRVFTDSNELLLIKTNDNNVQTIVGLDYINNNFLAIAGQPGGRNIVGGNGSGDALTLKSNDIGDGIIYFGSNHRGGYEEFNNSIFTGLPGDPSSSGPQYKFGNVIPGTVLGVNPNEFVQIEIAGQIVNLAIAQS